MHSIQSSERVFSLSQIHLLHLSCPHPPGISWCIWSLTTVSLVAVFFLLISTTPEIFNPEEPRATCLAWEHLTQSLVLLRGAMKLRLSQEKGPPQNPTGGQRQGWDPKPHLLHILTHQDPCWEINPNQALELWGECRHSINIQMRETFRRLFSLCPHPFLHRGLASFPPGSGKNWAVSKPFCVKTLGALVDAASLWSHNAL